jgi:hypothetical protein
MRPVRRAPSPSSRPGGTKGSGRTDGRYQLAVALQGGWRILDGRPLSGCCSRSTGSVADRCGERRGIVGACEARTQRDDLRPKRTHQLLGSCDPPIAVAIAYIRRSYRSGKYRWHRLFDFQMGVSIGSDPPACGQPPRRKVVPPVQLLAGHPSSRGSSVCAF